MRGEYGLVLAAQAIGQCCGQAAKGLALGINDVPVALDGLVLGNESLHGNSIYGVLGRAGSVACARERRLALSLPARNGGETEAES